LAIWLKISSLPGNHDSSIPGLNWNRRAKVPLQKQDLHSLQASGKIHNIHLWYVPRFELLQNRMDTNDPVPYGHQWSGAIWTPRIRCRMDTKDPVPHGHQGSGAVWTPRIRCRMDTKDPVPSSMGIVIPRSVRLAFWFSLHHAERLN